MSKYSKRVISSVILSLLIVVSVAPSIYAAPPTGTVTQAPSQCVLKSDLSPEEVTALTGAGSTGAGTGMTGGTTLNATTAPGYGVLCTYGLIKQITNIIWLLVGLLSIAAILYSAFLFMTSQSVPAKLGEARSVLLFAIIGIVVAVSARFLPNLILSFIGVGGGVS